MVFVHGAMDRGAAFLKVTRRLDGARSTVYDRRGYGRSSSGEPSPTFDDHVEDLIAVVSAMRGDGPTIVVGHSLGGTIALHAAARVPSLADGLVLYESPLPWLEWWPDVDGDGRRIEDDPPEIAAERFMRRVIGTETWLALPTATRDRRRAEGRILVSELVTARRAVLDPSRVAVTTIVGRGDPADEVRRRASQWLVDQLPKARCVAIPGAPHGSHLTHPGEFAALVDLAIVDANGSTSL